MDLLLRINTDLRGDSWAILSIITLHTQHHLGCNRSVQIYVFHNGQQMAPLPVEEVLKRLKAGELFPNDLAWHEGLPNWVPLSEIKEIQIPPGSALIPPVIDQGPTEPRVWTVFASYVLTLGIFLLSTIILVVVAILVSGGNPSQMKSGNTEEMIQELIAKPKVFLPIVFVGQLVVLISAFICAGLSKTPFRERLSIRSPKVSFLSIILFMLGSMALSQGFGAVMSLAKVEVSGTIKTLTEVLNNADGSYLLLMVFVIGFTPGVCEELFFRGYIQTRLTQRWGVKISILVTSALFAIFHMDFLQGLFVILLGLYLGLTLEKTGSLWVPILCHAGTNVSATLLTWSFKDFESSWIIDVSVLFGALTIAGIAVWSLWKLPYAKTDNPVNSGEVVTPS